jgi:hypothetical protein
VRPWITYLGSDVNRLAVNSSGTVAVAGSTTAAAGLSTKNAAQGTYGGGNVDGFAASLGPDGTTKWATFLGGQAHDHADAVAIDGSGAVYVLLETNEPGMATTGAFDTVVNVAGTANGSTDALAVKYSPTGVGQFSTYIGGSSNETAGGIGVSPSCQSACEIFIGGTTQSTDFPESAGADQGTLDGAYDGFIFKLVENPSTHATSRAWATYLRSSNGGVEEVHALAVNNAGQPAVAGNTSSYGNGIQAMFQTYNPATGTRVDPDMLLGFGGPGNDIAEDIAFDAQGNAYITGSTTSSSGIATSGGIQTDLKGGSDGFVAKMKADGTVPVIWGTYLGGFSSDGGRGIATDSAGGVFVVGSTSSNDFPLASSTQANSTPGDAFISLIQVPPVAITSAPPAVLRSHTASFTYSSGEPGGTFTCRLTPAESSSSACPNAGKTFTGLADGAYTFEIATVDRASTIGPVAQHAFTVDTRPVASLAIAPNPVLAGRVVTFDGTASSGADQPIVKYEWDLDGDGTFELDTGTTPTTTKTFPAPATVPVQLRVTDGAGAVGVGAGELLVNAPPGVGGQFGVTINKGAQYTKSPNVTVGAVFPAGTTSLLFSNDGGFLEPTQFNPSPTVKWKLDSSGPERLPKTIYVRFLVGTFAGQTFQDDIILDEVPPKVTEAAVAPAAPAAAAARVATVSRLRSWKVRMRAKDTNSGVSRVQVTSNKKKPGKLLKYKKRFKVKSKKRPRWVRARDKAGNYSKWRKAR